jgi:hypothetical protein
LKWRPRSFFSLSSPKTQQTTKTTKPGKQQKPTKKKEITGQLHPKQLTMARMDFKNIKIDYTKFGCISSREY